MKFLISILAIILFAGTSLAQKDTSFFDETATRRLADMSIKYHKPKGFTEHRKPECFDIYFKLGDIITCSSYNLTSDDGECIVFLTIYQKMTEQRASNINKLFPNNISNVNNIHLNLQKHIFKTFFLENQFKAKKDYLHYYSDSDARKKFNADSAFYISFPMGDVRDRYQGKYENFYMHTVQKKDNGYISFYLLYTDKAKKRLNKYLRPLLQMYTYQGDLRQSE